MAVPFYMLWAWLPGVFANLTQLIFIGKVDNVFAIFFGGGGWFSEVAHSNTMAFSFSLGDIWIAVAAIYFEISIFIYSGKVLCLNFEKTLFANKIIGLLRTAFVKWV